MAQLCRRPWRTSYFVGPDVQLGRDSPGKSLAVSLLVVMTMASEGVVLPVGGVILEPIPYARVATGENPVHLLDEQRRRLWRRYLVEGVVGGDTSWLGGGRTAIGVAGRLGAGGKLKGVAELMRRRPTSCWRPGVALCLSSWLLAADCGGCTALQLSVRRGTVSEGGAYGNDKVGRLGLQRIVVGGPATLWLLWCGPSSEDGASDNLSC